MELTKIINFLAEEDPESLNGIRTAIELLNEEFSKTKASIIEKAGELMYKNEMAMVDECQDIVSKITAVNDEFEKILLDFEDRKIHCLSDNLTGTTPLSFKIEGMKYESTKWNDLFEKTCTHLHEKNSTLFLSCVNDKNFRCFHIDTERKDNMKLLAGIEVHYRNMSVKEICETIQKFLKKYKISENSFKIYIDESKPLKRHRSKCVGYNANTKKCIKKDSVFVGNKCSGSSGCKWYEE